VKGFKVTDEQKEAFLKALRATGNLAGSARLAGVHPCTIRLHMRLNPEFEESVCAARHRGLEATRLLGPMEI
jgi:hypothetical protein